MKLKKAIFVRNATFLTLLATSLCLTAQENWQFGIEATPSYYMLYNQNDWQAEDYILVKQTDIADIQGFSGGFRASVDISEHWGLTSGLRYTWGRQDYVWPNSNINSIYSSVHYLQLPIMVSFGGNNDYLSRVYGSLGFGINYLVDYTENRSGTRGLTGGEELYYRYTFMQYEENRDGVKTLPTDRMYHRFMINLMGEIGYKFTFDNNWGINLALQGQYGLTNPEDRDAKVYTNDAEPIFILHGNGVTRRWGAIDGERKMTRMIHIGVLVGVYFQIDRWGRW